MNYPYPDFNEHGYQVVRELGRNREGGRITWLASNVGRSEQVVLKQFCFAQAASSWSGFQTHQREIDILKGLKHPGIPSYLNSFATSDGFCLVQEYIDAPSLAQTRSFAPEEIKQIAVNALEILGYLQNRNPSVIHRDIKPENILVDETLNVYLIDFGFARIGSQEVAGSSVFKGTPGFLPPEQMFEPTKATDLYALGTTLICLLTGIKSINIRQLQDQDDPYLIKFRHRLPQLSLRFLGWLENMVQPLQKNRFPNAKVALEALKPLDVIRVAGVDFSETVLEFKAKSLGEQLTQSITIKNPISDTVLTGRWEVAPHPHDPPHTPDFHAWISVKPAKFKGNNTQCQIQVDTSKLMADKQYKRQLILHCNAYPETHTLTVKVQTASIPIQKQELPYAWLAGVLLIGVIAPIFLTSLMAVAGLFLTVAITGLSLAMILLIATFDVSTVMNAVGKGLMGAFIGLIVGFGIGSFIFIILATLFDLYYRSFKEILRIGIISGAIVGFGIGGISVLHFQYNYNVSLLRKWHLSSVILYLLTAGFGTSLGMTFIVGIINPYIPFALTVTGLPLISIGVYSPLKRHRLIAKYRQSENSLIKP
ncbi:MAG: serine/threonine protein kinase [Nodularia sp. (in: Bacteria)]|nr:MAG: serine/threonine protein kinase [Nodularia sp. (in: cyanobacteria)]